MIKKLFKENFLSSENVKYKEKKKYLTIQKLIKNNYKILQFEEDLKIVEILSSGNINKNYLITTNKKKFVLKRIKKENPNEIINQLRFSDFLIKKNFKTISFIKTINDEDFIFSKSNYWILFKYIEGKYFSGNFNEFKEATKGFCNFIKILSECSKKSQTKDIDFKFLQSKTLKKINLRNKKKFFLLHIKQIEDSLEILKKNKELLKKKKIVHTDFHPQNLLFKNNKLKAVLDFEDVAYYSVIAAQGFAFFKLIRHKLVKNKKNTNLIIKQYKFFWINYWNKTFPLLKINSEILKIGALCQIIHLINDILKRCSKNDFSQLNGLENQIHYLYEIEKIFHEINNY